MLTRALCFLLLMIIGGASCHKSASQHTATLSGKVAIDFSSEKAAGELFLAVFKGDDFEKLLTNVVDSIVTIIPIDKNNPVFNIEAQKFGLEIGNEVCLVAFVDKTFAGGVPKLSPSDLVGVYLDKKNFTITHAITSGENSDLDVNVNREYFETQNKVNGVIKGDYTGNLIMIAYAGEVTSLSFHALDFDRVVAVQKLKKSGPELPYTLELLPFTRYFPVNNAYIFVLFDENGNGKPDAGEKIAYYSANPRSMPTMVSLGDGATADLDASLSFTVDEGGSSDGMSLSGKLILPADHANSDKPLYAIVADAKDPDAFVQAPIKAVKAFQKLDEGSSEFTVDLSGTDLKVGDKVMIMGLEDRNGDGNFPDLTPGDFIGIYINQKSSTQTYILKPGANANIEIELNREVFGFDKKIEGTVSGDYKGNVLVVAYAGEINSMDKSQLDLGKVIGLSHFNKADGQMRYSMQILPYGYNLPINGVYVFAVFDANNNGTPDSGEAIGFYSSSQNGLPTRITIDSGDQNNIDIAPVSTIATPSGIAMSVTGNVTFPMDAASGARPTFVVVAKGNNPDDVLTAPMESVKAFTKLASNQATYTVDLSKTDLKPGDEVMVIALWDVNNDGGMPSANAGDVVGFYYNPTTFASTVGLAAGVNRDINIKINREVYNYDKSISGTINGDISGDVVVMAYDGKIESFDFSQFDFDHILGYRKFKNGGGPLAYRLSILPLGHPLPISGVYVIAFLDSNGNGRPDAGELLGFYSNRSDKLPTQITIGDHTRTDINLDLFMKIAKPSGANIAITGRLTPPASAVTSGKPVYVVVAEAESPSDIMSRPMDTIKYFARVDITSGSYTIDLSKTDLTVGDNVIVMGLDDENNDGGFPSLSDGDYIGFYKNSTTMSAALTLENGGNSDVNLVIDQKVYGYDTSVSGGILSSYTGNVVVFAYLGEITSSNFKNLNPDNIIGYQKLTKTAATLSYNMDIMPYGRPLPLVGVYIFALFDQNGNGTADKGESIGYYTTRTDQLPTLVTIGSSPLAGIDIGPITAVPAPSGQNISLSGNISLSKDLAAKNKPLYVVVANAQNASAIADTPAQNVRYFERIQPGQSSYNISLASTDLKAGDEILLAILWDGDYAGGFPAITAGDYLGIYTDSKSMKLSYKLLAGINKGLDIEANRQVFGFNKSLSGRISDSYTGKLTVFAYNGSIDSMDLTKIDQSKVVGYTTLMKSSSSPLDFTMKVLPFGQNLPLNNVMMLAIYDKNGNGTADPGEAIGYYTSGEGKLPALTLVSAGSSTLYTISPRMTVAQPSGANIAISGTLRLPSGVAASGKPVYVVIAKTDDPSAVQTDPMNTIKYFAKVDPNTGAYSINLGAADLGVGDNIMIIGLWDKDYVAGFPSLTTGDYIGYYRDTRRMSATLTLQSGNNSAVDVAISQQVYNYKRNIAGTINASYTGKMVVFAYQGEITSLDFRTLNLDNVIGYTTFAKSGEAAATYSLDILPYGHPLPLQGVYVFALFDSNGNGTADPGESIGFYSSRSDKIPTYINLDNEVTTGIDLSPSLVIKKPSGYTINVSGNISIPSSLASQNKPLYLVVSDASNPTGIKDTPMQSIRFFQKLGVNPNSYNVDISSTDIKPGDDVMIGLLWDHDNVGDFPSINEGDYVGFYTNKTAMRMSRRITAGNNSGLDIAVDKQYFNFNKSISGRVTDRYVGKITLIAYNGSIDSMDFSQIDLNHVVGYSSLDKSSSAPLDFSMPILPFNQNLPFYNVQLYAIYDSDGNGSLDPGEQFGYYSNNSQSLPELTTVSSSSSTFYTVSAKSTIPTPSGQNIVIQGSVMMPSDYATSGKPAYIIVARGSNVSDLMSNPMSSTEYFQKLPLGGSAFSINLSKTALRVGDDVMILALWDKNYVAGFPSLTPGNRIGIYTNTSTISFTRTLASGVNTVTNQGSDQFAVTRTIYSHNANIQFTLDSHGSPALNQGDQILIAAVQEGGTSASDYKITNTDYVVAFKTFNISSLSSLTFNLPILTALKPEITSASPFGINKIYVYAIIDKNRNGRPDSAESIGFFYQQSFIFQTPALTNVANGTNTLPRNIVFPGMTY